MLLDGGLVKIRVDLYVIEMQMMHQKEICLCLMELAAPRSLLAVSQNKVIHATLLIRRVKSSPST